MTQKKLVSVTAVAVFLLLGFAGGTSVRGQVLNSNLPPGGNFNLTNWYLGLPVDSTNGTAGESASISAAQLTAGYSNAFYFYTGPDGAMTFWAPVTGASTEGSTFARSELREQVTPGNNNINWRGYGLHILNATCKVTELPSTSKVIIGQIHTKTGSARPLVKLQYNNGTIEALVKVYSTNTLPNTDNKLTFQNVGLGNLIAYTIQMENGMATVTVNGLSQSTNTFLTDPDWANQEFYFKAGSYCQDNVGTTNEGARVTFYALSRNHAPSIINQPASISVGAGTTTNFNVGASGNGTLLYQWRRNGTNLPVNATSATLTLTNIQSAHAGDYSVKVTDSLGSVTSVVASLTVTNATTNTPPSFIANPINKLGTTVGVYYGGSLGADATDPDTGDVLTFNKVSGPAWLSVAGNGTLSGTPGAGDLGTNHWIVQVTDLASASNQATLRIIVSAATEGPTVTNIIVNDSFADGNRARTGALDANWWSSSSTSGNSVEISVGSLGLISGTAGRGIHGTFAPQALAIGSTIIATYTFTTPATAGSGSASFKVAMMDFNNPGLAADLSSASGVGNENPLYVGLPGYMSDFDVNSGATADISIRKHDVASPLGRFLGTTSEWIDQTSSADKGYTFAPNTQYIGVFSITRTGADSVQIFSSMSNNAGLMDSHTKSDTNGIANNFGMFGIWANSGMFGSNTTPGDPDNGITFSNIKVELVTIAAPALGIALSSNKVVVSWTTNGTAGFALESATNYTPPIVWTAAGASSVVGENYHVTNSLTGDEKYYRLKNP
jgi:hypothetical protein